MTAVETGLVIDEATVEQVCFEVGGQKLKLTHEEEMKFMQPGMESFDARLFADACRTEGDTAANQARAGLLVTHRVLRYSHEGDPLPPPANAQLARMSERISFPLVMNSIRYARNRRDVFQAFPGNTGLELLFNDKLRNTNSRATAALLLRVYASYISPSVAVIHDEQFMHPVPAQRQSSHGSQQMRKRR